MAAGGLGATGVIGSQSIITAAADDVEEPAWNKTINARIGSSPTIVMGTVYVGSEGNNAVYAISANTGEEEWMTRLDGAVYPAVSAVDGRVYAGSDDTNVYALDATTGEIEWQTETGASVRSSPTVVGDTVYVGSNDGYVYALDAADGSISWSVDTGSQVQSAPTVTIDAVYIGDESGELYAFDTETGDTHWQVQTGGSIITAPTVAGSTVYVGNEEGEVVAADINDGSELWTFTTGSSILHSVSVANNYVYAVSGDGNAYGINITDGSEAWVEDVGWPESPITVAGEMAFVTAQKDSEPVLLGIDATEGDEQWRYSSQEVLSTPIVTDGTAFVGHDSGLIAVSVPVPGSSSDTRVQLGTEGHHDLWTGQAASPPTMNDPELEEAEEDDPLPGFGVGATITGIGGVLYALRRYSSPNRSKRDNRG